MMMQFSANQAGANQVTGQGVETVLREELARGDGLLDAARPILRHLLANDDHSLFSDETVARVRGMLEDIAAQLLDPLDQAAGAPEGTAVAQWADQVALTLLDQPALLGHLHALALEWQLTERLQERCAIDAVLTPLLQALIASSDASVAETAMAMLAAQARFVQHQRRMQLPLTELPGDLFHAALLTLRGCLPPEHDAAAAAAESALRAGFDESRSRLGLASRLVTAMGGGAMAALSLAHGGAAIFLTAVGLASAQPREVAVLATNERQLARLALSLRASGLKPAAVEEQFALLHPEIVLPEGFEQLRVDRAATILAQSAPVLTS